MIYGDNPGENPAPDIAAVIQSGNLYAYCMGNPVRWIDPTGYILILSGTDEENNISMEELGKLTDDKLKLNKDGTVSITESSSNPTKQDGTSLVCDIIKSDKKVTIVINDGEKSSCGNITIKGLTNGNDGLWGKGSGTTVKLDPRQASKENPLHIILGHELVHSLRSIQGKIIQLNLRQNYYVDGKKYNVPKEELITTGIWTGNENNPMRQYVTENSLRKENNLEERKIY